MNHCVKFILARVLTVAVCLFAPPALAQTLPAPTMNGANWLWPDGSTVSG